MSTNVPARTSRSAALPSVFAPFRSFRDEMDELISRFTRDWDGGALSMASFRPATDIAETADALEVRLDAPGMKPEDISIEVTGNVLKISGERKEEKEEKGKTFHRVERRSGQFYETMTLPCAVKEDKVEAKFDDGVLTVTMPKSEEAKTHKVQIKSNGGRSK